MWTSATEDWGSVTGIVIYIQPFIYSCLYLCLPVAIPALLLSLTCFTLPLGVQKSSSQLGVILPPPSHIGRHN